MIEKEKVMRVIAVALPLVIFLVVALSQSDQKEATSAPAPESALYSARVDGDATFGCTLREDYMSLWQLARSGGLSNLLRFQERYDSLLAQGRLVEFVEGEPVQVFTETSDLVEVRRAQGAVKYWTGSAFIRR